MPDVQLVYAANHWRKAVETHAENFPDTDHAVADISQVNAGMDRAGHMLQGGVFLREFVAEDVPWAHIDIAGPSYHSGEPTGYWAKGGTGVPVRTLLTLIDDIAAIG